MNNNQTSNDETGLIKSIYYLIVGSTWRYDSIYLFLITPMGLLGVLFNSISFGIFMSKKFRTQAIFKYLQVFTFNSLVLSATFSFSFLISPRYFFDLSHSLSARILKCYLVPSVIVSLLFYFNNAIDVLINIQVAAVYTFKLDRFKRANPHVMCAIVFAICFLVNSPNYLLLTISTDEQVNGALSSLASIMKFKGLCLRNPIYLTPFGTAITMFGFAVKELLTLSLEIGSSLTSIFYMKSYYKRNRDLRRNNVNHQELISKSEKNKTIMALSLTILSICLHCFEFAAVFIIFFVPNIVPFEYSMLIYVFISFKQLINFPLFCLLNRKFRRTLCFRDRKHTSESTRRNITHTNEVTRRNITHKNESTRR